jgi:hypothetical protein
VPYTYNKHEQIIAAVNKGNLLWWHRCSAELPKSGQDAFTMDEQTNNTNLTDFISLEIKNVDVTFYNLKENEDLPVGYQFVKFHLILDVKVGRLKQKTLYVAGEHMNKPPAAVTYASLVSRESVRLRLLIAELKDLSILLADIQNAYLTSSCEEKVYRVLGPEFGPNRQGRKTRVVRALYGLKSAGASFRNHLTSCLRHLG